MELDTIHVYDPKENQIFIQENTVFSWYHNDSLKEAGIKNNEYKSILLLSSL